jgi:hypothetical protein
VPDIVIFTQHRGRERVWVPEADVEWWLRFYGRGGAPACRWRDYVAWGGFWPPHPGATELMFYPRTRGKLVGIR